MRFRHAIVVGASSGLGRELGLQLAADGCRVAAVAPSLADLGPLVEANPSTLLPFAHDVRSVGEVPEIFLEVTRQLGGLDLVVYCAGVMPAVRSDEFDTAKDAEMVAVNLTGAIAWLNQAAIRFQNVRAGTIVGIGSVAGDRGRVGNPVYNATKAGLATYLEALRNRLARRGVTVVTIKPGPMRTAMTAHLDQKGMMDPAVAARLILRKASRTGEHYLKPTHKLIFWAIRHMPSFIFRRLKI